MLFLPDERMDSAALLLARGGRAEAVSREVAMLKVGFLRCEQTGGSSEVLRVVLAPIRRSLRRLEGETSGRNGFNERTTMATRNGLRATPIPPSHALCHRGRHAWRTKEGEEKVD
jgi:hypothetical protein